MQPIERIGDSGLSRKDDSLLKYCDIIHLFCFSKKEGVGDKKYRVTTKVITLYLVPVTGLDGLCPSFATRTPDCVRLRRDRFKSYYIEDKKYRVTTKVITLYLVPVTGLEPVRCCHRGILSPLRLPIPPHRHSY